MTTRPWLQGGGLAMFYLLPLIALFLDPGQDGFYHQVMPVTSLTRAALIDLLLLGFLVGLGFAWLKHLKPPLLQRLLWIPVLFVTAWLVERGVAEYFRTGSTSIHLPSWASQLPWLALVSAVLLLLFSRRYYDLVVRTTEVFLMSAGIAAVFIILPRLVIACFNHAPPEQAFFTHPVRQAWQPGEPRIVWVLFDELSYNQVFDHRQPDVNLPAFTRLKQESLSFSQLVPVANMTELVIPGLFLGHPVSAVKSNSQGALLWRSSPQMAWQSFRPDATVFAAARLQGWGTGVAGWYNPYCRLLATTLDRCYWTYREFAGGERFNRLSSQRSMWENARDGLPFVAQIENAWRHTSSRQSHGDDYRSVLTQAESLIADENIRFAFIHMPAPHPPGIFPNPSPSARGRQDYLGNLMLADQALAEFQSVIAKTAASSDTIFIISSDHSWRVPIWRSAPGWTREEERASNGGTFDQRPVLMVRFPQQTRGEQIDRPESAMLVHSLLLDLIAGKARTPEDWIATLPPAAAAVNQVANKK
jgi:Sulfatase